MKRKRKKDSATRILNATDNPELLEIYTNILNPQRHEDTADHERPVNVILQYHIPRPQREEPMLSTTAHRKRKQLSDTGKLEADRLTNIAKKASSEQHDSMTVEGISGSTEALIVAINELYNRCAQLASTFGVQTRDITAKLDAMAHGQQ